MGREKLLTNLVIRESGLNLETFINKGVSGKPLDKTKLHQETHTNKKGQQVKKWVNGDIVKVRNRSTNRITNGEYQRQISKNHHVIKLKDGTEDNYDTKHIEKHNSVDNKKKNKKIKSIDSYVKDIKKKKSDKLDILNIKAGTPISVFQFRDGGTYKTSTVNKPIYNKDSESFEVNIKNKVNGKHHYAWWDKKNKRWEDGEI